MALLAMAISATAMSAQSEPLPGSDAQRPVAPVVSPGWIRSPSADELASIYPAWAKKKGSKGSATVRCTVTVEGTLSACVVVEEHPTGLGFGAAALKAAEFSRMRPELLGGKPVGSGKVQYTIHFAPPGTF